jgi:N utilization substance protein B
MARHRARQQALQLLFQWDQRRTAPEEIIGGYYGSLLVDDENPQHPERDEFAESLFRGVVQTLPAVDEIIGRHAANWKIPRMPAVDRNILRLAVYEMMSGETPGPVVIDEALVLARRFSAEESVQFVNGVLDAVNKEFTAPVTAPKPEA